MRVRVKPLSKVQNRDFGKKYELSLGEARVNTMRVQVISQEQSERMTIAQLHAPPEQVTIEVLWHDHATISKYKRWVREHPEYELVE